MLNNTKILPRKFEQNTLLKLYKNVSFFYDLWGRLTESKAAAYALNSARINNRQTVLEVGCGTGKTFEKILQLNPNGINIGMDISLPMLRKALNRAKKVKGSRFLLEIGNAFSLNFESHTFDRLLNNFMVDLLPEEKFNLISSEFYRVLKPNGIVVVSTFAITQNTASKLWYWTAKNFPLLLTGCRPVSFSESLERAGFKIEHKKIVIQNTFPAEIIKAVK